MSSSSLAEDGRGGASRPAGDDRRDAVPAPSGVVNGKSPGPNALDVLYSVGGAAQSTTHPGNLRFYALCEARYDDWRRARPGRSRGRIAAEVVDAVAASGGTFRDRRGGILSRAAAVDKARDRFRGIGKPKVRPKEGGFGPHDVVFAMGGKNRMYPGNARWRALVDDRAPRYFREALDERHAVARRVGAPRLPHKIEVVDEILRVVRGRGGTFRDARLRELRREEAAEKTHDRFRDVKNRLVGGGRTWSGSGAAASGGAEARRAAVEDRSGGFTSVKAVVSNERDLRRFKRKETIERRSNKQTRCPRSAKNNSDDSSDSDVSFQSDALGSGGDSSDDEEDSDGSTPDEAEDDCAVDAPKRIDKRQQDTDRAERLKRRNEGRLQRRNSATTRPIPRPDKTMRKRRGGKKQERRKKRRDGRDGEGTGRDPSPDRPLSEYELYRLEKIRRNRAKLAELGLA